jgi:predicted hotdog family 3-hydroxylacyl-ACP dehydratase
LAIGRAEIGGLIPHSGAMCLIDTVVTWDETTITCLTNSHRAPDNPLLRHNRLATLHAFEYGAQAAAIHGGLIARTSGITAPCALLAAIRKARMFTERLDTEAGPLTVFATLVFGDSAGTIYDCHVAADDRLLASARLTMMLTTIRQQGDR